MYKHRNRKRVVKPAMNSDEQRQPMNTIDENTTIKIPRTDDGDVVVPGDASNKQNLQNSEEACVPASQEPTQRYLSQRSTIASSLTRTQSRNPTNRPPNTYFELLLIKAGVDLNEEDNLVLSCDHVIFVGRFRELMAKAQNYPDNVETFKSGLRAALAPHSKLRLKLLNGCTISVPGGIYQSQDSMVVNFFMIDFLCQHVLDELLDGIDEAACNEPRLGADTNGVPLLPLMLFQLRYVAISHSEHIFARITDIYGRAVASAKWNIIGSVKLILDAKRHDDFVQLLIDSAPDSKTLFHSVTIQALADLCLSSVMQFRLRNKIRIHIKDGQIPDKALSGLIKFMLANLNNDNNESASELAKTLREIIIWRTTTDCSPIEPQSQLEIFTSIEIALVCSKKLFHNWQKIIAATAQFCSIDFIILLVVMHIKEDNVLYIENLLRRRIKQNDINVDMLIECKQHYEQVLEQKTKTLIIILQDFLREKNVAVVGFAKASYIVLFHICPSTQKSIIEKLMQLSCDLTATHVTNSLGVLKNLQQRYPLSVYNWGLLLMPLLDRLGDMSLSQTRVVMELLCSIAYPAPTVAECQALQDQIDMIVKKQLLSRTPFIQKQGVIGSIRLIDNIARVEKTAMNSEDMNASFTDLSSLPDGRGKDAANYIMRVQHSTFTCAETLALFFDELASACHASPSDRANSAQLDQPFLIWICNVMTQYFDINFLAEDTPDTIFGIAMSHQMCINSSEDIDDETELPTIAVNITELVFKPSTHAMSSIVVLAPLFNLLRTLHQARYQGSLTNINALLGCAIILPVFFDEPDAVFVEYEEPMQKQILDIYYHCVNWLREVISSFAAQDEKMIRTKVLKRLTDVISIEETIRRLLIRAPTDYIPPISQFITDQPTSLHTIGKAPVRGRAAAAKPTNTKQEEAGNASANHTNPHGMNVEMITQVANTTVMQLAAAGKGKAVTTRINFDNYYGPKESYRQMDFHIMLILHVKLNTKYPLPLADIGESIGLLEFRFILTDIVNKLESVTGVHCQSKQNMHFIAQPHFFMLDLAKFFTIIAANMDMISDAIDNELERAEHVYGNPELFTDHFNYLKVCFCLCLRLLATFFSFQEFADTTRTNLLKESLVYLLGKSDDQRSQLRTHTTSHLALEAFRAFAKYEKTIVHLKTAVYFYQFMVALKRHSSSSSDSDTPKTQAREIHALCKKFLTRKWFNYEGSMEKGATCNFYLEKLVKGFLKDTDFSWQRKMLRTILEECKCLGNKESALKSFPNFKRANFPLLFRGLCDNLLSSLNDLIVSSANAGMDDKLDVWEASCALINQLLDIGKVLNDPRNFQLFLKSSYLYLKLVLQHGLQVFEQQIVPYPERIRTLLRDLQITTRFLHNLCCEAKAASKNNAVFSQMPFVRETVETFVYSVKALLTVNKCASVFFMANLKNRDLQGEDIVPQAATFSSITGENSDEDIPEDEVSINETTDGVEDNSQQHDDTASSSSRSKCF